MTDIRIVQVGLTEAVTLDWLLTTNALLPAQMGSMKRRRWSLRSSSHFARTNSPRRPTNCLFRARPIARGGGATTVRLKSGTAGRSVRASG